MSKIRQKSPGFSRSPILQRTRPITGRPLRHLSVDVYRYLNKDTEVLMLWHNFCYINNKEILICH